MSLRRLTAKSICQHTRVQIDIRAVLQNKYRQSQTSDYLQNPKQKRAQDIKRNIDVDSLTGATSRRSMFQQYFQEQPSLGSVYPMNSGRGAFMEPDCRWNGNDFLGKLNEKFAPSISQSYKDIDVFVKARVDQNRDLIKSNLEKLFRDKYPNKEFDFDREYARYLKLDSKKFMKEYGFESD